MQKVSVITPYNLDIPYSYLASKPLAVGNIVLVSVRSRNTFGVVVNTTIDDSYSKPLKNIIGVLQHISLSPQLIQFLTWCADYNFIGLGVVLKMIMPVAEAVYEDLSVIKQDVYITNKSSLEKLLSNKPNKITKFLQNHSTFTKNDLKNSRLTIKTIEHLLAENLVTVKQKESKVSFPKQTNINTNLPIQLSCEQQRVYQSIQELYHNKVFEVILLEGVTGSGKTEVYFSLIAEAIKEGGTVLVLLPEIALSKQWLTRFSELFKVEPYLWHSGISKSIKKKTYAALLNNQVKVLVGTRSALFLPFKNLKLIIVDEEHEHSYKQEERFFYHARDMAIVRAKVEDICIILTTATPSLETWYNAKTGKYKKLELKSRFNQIDVPTIEVIEHNSQNNHISLELKSALEQNLKAKQLSLLFLNKRGYSTSAVCTECKQPVLCPRCSHDELYQVVLSKHVLNNSFICHRCGYKKPFSTVCSCCNSDKGLALKGYGVEKVYEEVTTEFPNVNIILVSSDYINKVGYIENLLQQINDNKVDIIVSTQVLAKGYHFAKLSLVGIINLEVENTVEDLKSREKAWQLLHQIAGRSGRENIKGRVILQSSNKDLVEETFINIKQEDFLEKELQRRKNSDLPPFKRLASVIISSSSEKKAYNFAVHLKSSTLKLPKSYQESISDFIPSQFYKLDNKYRYRFLVQADNASSLHKIIKVWLKYTGPIKSSVSLKIDIDAINFL